MSSQAEADMLSQVRIEQWSGIKRRRFERRVLVSLWLLLPVYIEGKGLPEYIRVERQLTFIHPISQGEVTRRFRAETERESNFPQKQR